MATTDTWLTLRYHFQIWRFLGICPPTGGAWHWKFIYTIYAIALNAVITILFPISFALSTIQATNMADFCDNFFKLIPDVLCSMKFILTWLAFDRLLALRPSMEYLDRRLNSSSEHRCVNDARKFTWRILVSIVGLFFCLWISALPVAFLSDGRQLTFSGWFPWDWQSTQLRYIFTNCFQYTCLTIQAAQDICSDSYPLGLLVMVGAHIRALGIRVRNIDIDDDDTVDFGIGLLRDGSMSIKAHRSVKAQAELNACIDDHKLLLRLLDTILGIISPICFYQFVCTALSVCTMGGFVLFAELNLSSLINTFFFFTVIVMETLMICSSGEIIYHECEQLTTAIYSCPWYNHDVKFQRTLLLMIARSQKIKEVMAANIVPVRISTFVAVMKGSYSMFTLLCKMSSK